MSNSLPNVKEEEAVIHAVERMKRKEEDAATDAAATLMDGGNLETDVMTNNSDRITFEVDEVQEFARALRDEDRSSSKRGNSIVGGITVGGGGDKPPPRDLKVTVPGANANNIVATSSTSKGESDIMVEGTNDMKVDDDGDENADMEEMARDMEADDASNIDDDLGRDEGGDDASAVAGLTREALICGQGMSSFLSHLRRTVPARYAITRPGRKCADVPRTNAPTKITRNSICRRSLGSAIMS